MSLTLRKNLYRKHIFVIAGLIVCISLIYSNSLNNSFQFDDLQITDRPNLHITNLSATSVKQTFIWTTTEPKLYRPLAGLTIGINYYFGQLDPFGYHLVNITIHLLCSIAVYCFIFLLLGIPNIRPVWFKKHQYELAALTCFLFALHPLQTNTATYIIQRMTSLAALFYIISASSFIIFRCSLLPTTKKNHTIAFFAISTMLLSGVASILSKENSAMLPITIIWMDYLFFYHQSTKKQKKISRYIYISFFTGPIFVALLLSPTSLSLLLNPQELIASFSHRNFTLTERLLTEPRIVLFYLFLLFIPRIDLLNLNHDVLISTDLYTPPQTLLSIILIIFLLVLAIRYHHRCNLISFAILWYFGNLIIESTIFPLELIYEHRSYLPGISIFMLIASCLYFISVNFLYKTTATFFLAAILIVYGNGTYLRNFVWRTPLTMWQDVVHKSPNSARAHTNYGRHLMTEGRTKEAKTALEKALDLDEQQLEAMSNLSKLLIINMNEPEKGLTLAKKLFEITPSNILGCMTLGNAYIYTQNYKAAEPYFVEAIKRINHYVPAINNLGICQIHNGKPEKAILTFQKGLAVDPGYENIALNLAKAYSNQGNKKKAKQLLSNFLRNNPNASRASDLYDLLESGKQPSTFPLSKVNTHLSTTISSPENNKQQEKAH